MSEEFNDYLICTGFGFGGRDFEVVVTHDGLSHWCERTPMRDLNITHPGYTLGALSGDSNAAKFLAQMEAEYTLSAPVPG